MKKLAVLLMMIFLGFSINGYSSEKASPSVKSSKTEQTKKGKAKSTRKPRKLVPKKRVHKPAPKRHSQNKRAGNIPM